MGLNQEQASASGEDWNQPAKAAPLRCPRCDSSNTKFCYYNNYSQSQPRHYCRACRRHWTAGGSLRDVPFGGARKSKRRKISESPAAAPAAATPEASCESRSVPVMLRPLQLPLTGSSSPSLADEFGGDGLDFVSPYNNDLGNSLLSCYDLNCASLLSAWEAPPNYWGEIGELNSFGSEEPTKYL